MSGYEIAGRYPAAYEDYLDDAVRDPDAYGITKERAVAERNAHYLEQGQEVPPVPTLNPHLFAKLPSLASLMT